MNERRPPRSVLVGMGETAGYCTGLVDGLRRLGVTAHHMNLVGDPLGYVPVDDEAVGVRLVRWLSLQRRRRRFRVMWMALSRLAMLLLLGWVAVRYDAFVFRAGDSFFVLRALPLLRLLRKRVVVVFFGTDSRPSYMNGAEVSQGLSGHRAAMVTATKRRIVERIERDASELIGHVMSAQLHRRRTIAFLEVGIPRRRPGREVVPERPTSDGIRALHAPSRPGSKGTAEIREAVERVQRAGVRIELQVVTGRPNHEVLDAIGSCDFVIDQLHSDTPMASFAVEAAAQGRPAIVAGYGWDELRSHASPASIPPTHLCHPADLSDAITRLATDHAYRTTLGADARAFVEKRWSSEEVARRILTVLTGAAPDAWYFEPAQIAYAHGAGVDEATLRRMLRSVIESDGVAGLHVSDKPRLEERLVQLAAAAERD